MDRFYRDPDLTITGKQLAQAIGFKSGVTIEDMDIYISQDDQAVSKVAFYLKKEK